MVRFIDLFAGIGGIRMGFERAFEDDDPETVFVSEWNKFSNQTYKANFHDDFEIVGDITQVPYMYTLSDKLWTYLQNYAAKHRAAGNGFGYGLIGPDSTTRTLSARYYKDGSEILVRQDEENPRRLTPRECARLQGFPDSFVIPVSDTQAYRQFGNSVCVPAVAAVARLMRRSLEG